MSHSDMDVDSDSEDERIKRWAALMLTQPSAPPFGTMRFDPGQGSQGTGMGVIMNNSTGFVVTPPPREMQFGQGDLGRDDSNTPAHQLVAEYGGGAQISGAFGIGAGDLSSTTHRDRQQGQIQGQLSTTQSTLSATQVARALGLETGSGLWEWLHLVAFSIGPTQVLGLSQASAAWLETSDQTAQITENLILGTKEANSAMLIFETAVKNFLRQNPNCALNLAVFTTGTQMIAVPGQGARLPVAEELHFDYFFDFGNNQVSPPASIQFALLSHAKPSFGEFESMYGEAAQNAAMQFGVSSVPTQMGGGLDKL